MTQRAVWFEPNSARNKALAGLFLVSLLLAATLSGGVVAAAEFGDKDRGSRVAARWCANCHIVSPDANLAPKDAIPTFAAIAARPAISDASLNTILTAPHGPMPTTAVRLRFLDILHGVDSTCEQAFGDVLDTRRGPTPCGITIAFSTTF